MPEPAQQRADAKANRAELLRVGAAALAELGVNASTREIARRAGLAVGTFFRHFPSKDDLIAAIMVDHYDRMRAIAEGLEASPALSPRDALEGYMERAAEQIAPDRGYFQVVLMAGIDSDGIRVSAKGLDDAIGRLLARAQADGSIRDDIVANDIQTLVQAATATVAPNLDFRPDLWKRYLALQFDAICTPSPRALPAPPLRFEDFSTIQSGLQQRRADA
jgi:AcrR family transcriptional regulator